MSKKVYDQAKLYYPQQWDKGRIDMLHDAEKLTDEEYQDVISPEEVIPTVALSL